MKKPILFIRKVGFFIVEFEAMTDETKENKESGLGENLTAVGQMIIGEIEAIGGILTGDPVTRAEGEFNVEVGSLHQESNKNLTAIEQNEKLHQNNSEEDAPFRNKE
jgi:hypothetical protein